MWRTQSTHAASQLLHQINPLHFPTFSGSPKNKPIWSRHLGQREGRGRGFCVCLQDSYFVLLFNEVSAEHWQTHLKCEQNLLLVSHTLTQILCLHITQASHTLHSHGFMAFVHQESRQRDYFEITPLSMNLAQKSFHPAAGAMCTYCNGKVNNYFFGQKS